jgi:hypothetical protein
MIELARQSAGVARQHLRVDGNIFGTSSDGWMKPGVFCPEAGADCEFEMGLGKTVVSKELF